MDFTSTFSLWGRETTTTPSGQRSHCYMSCDGHSMSVHTAPTVMYGVCRGGGDGGGERGRGRGRGEGGGGGGGECLQFLCPRERGSYQQKQ